MRHKKINNRKLERGNIDRQTKGRQQSLKGIIESNASTHFHTEFAILGIVLTSFLFSFFKSK